MSEKIPKQLIKPRGGWKERTWYLVDVEYFKGNPRHRSLFFSGFLNGEGKTPGGYSGLVGTGGYVDDHSGPGAWRDVRYLRFVRRLFSEEELNGKEPVILEKDTRKALMEVAHLLRPE